MEFSISYIISTKNRLPFLKITLGKLIELRQEDEEIVVVDGNSTDGTKEYLQQLLDESKINQYKSETDKNQAHGWNKAILMAKGQIIKKIIDDDVFNYPSIRLCKNYMLSNPDIDVIISNDLSCIITNAHKIDKHSRLEPFNQWRNKHVPSFTFGDVHMLIRRSSISFIGLYSTEFIMMDWEFSLRISYLKSNITYYTGYNALSVSHPGNVTSNASLKKIKQQGEKGKLFYEYAGDFAEISFWSKIKIEIGKIINKSPVNNQSSDIDKKQLCDIYNDLYSYLQTTNNSHNYEFINS